MIFVDGSWRDWTGAIGPTSVTIGVLDGVHRGHRALLERLDATMSRAVLTFEPHPVEILRPGTQPRLITTIPERAVLLEEAGMDWVGVLDLTEIKDQSPTEFVEQVLVGKLNVGHLVVGEDFRFGKDRAGDVELLTRLGDVFGFAVETIELLVSDDGSPVSSSRIRALIEDGDVDTAATLCGSWFAVTNTVVDGDKRGRDIGFPTANVHPPKRKVVPGTGVYACFATIAGIRRDAAVNVGVRPTFGGGELLIEAFILGFDEDIYGNDMTVEFVKHLRPEIRFDGVPELVSQMKRDVEASRVILEETRSRM